MEETYIRVNGEFMYLYRALDTNGGTIDFSLFRKYRDKAAALAFFRKAIKHNGNPEKALI